MILTIDCGSTNLKAALFDEQLRRVAERSVPVQYSLRDTERVEFDPERFWKDCLALLRQIPAPAPIDTVTLTSQAQTFTVLDGQGRARVPFYSWMDKRATAESDEIQQRLGDGFHRHCSFPTPVAFLQSAKVLWVRRHQPQAFAGDARVVSLPEFVAMRLAGVNVVDRNVSAMSGLYSLAQAGWWDEALEMCGLRPDQFGALVDVGGSVPGTRAVDDLPLVRQPRIVMAGNDQTSGAFGTIGHSGGLVLTLGTALVVYRFAGTHPGPFAASGCWGPYPGGGYYELATRGEGCAALDWAIGHLLPGTHPDKFREFGTSAPLGSALFFPHRMGLDGAWTGSDDTAARARAVVEGISFSARQLLTEDLGLQLGDKPVTVIGGGSRSRLWLQLLADILNCPVQRGQGDNLLGSALMAAQSGPPSAAAATGDPLRPDPASVSDYAALYQRWRAKL